MSAARAAQAARPWLAIIGIGEDGCDGLTGPARALLASASLVVGGRRHLDLAAPLITGDTMPWPSPMTDAYPAILARAGTEVAVLASGDPFWFGAGSALATLAGANAFVAVPAPSAFALACARLGWAQQEITTLSFCGRPLAAAIPHLQPGARLLALSADGSTPAAFAALLQERGFGRSVLHIMEALGGPRERVRTCRAETVPSDVGPLNLVAAELTAGPGARVVPLTAGLADEWFENDGQLTKREVRAATLAALAPRAGELLWDVGAGSGSVAIEWCLRGAGCRAVAIEPRPDRASRIARNALSLGATAIDVVMAPAPAALAGLPFPDAIFLGGGVQTHGVLDVAVAALKPGGRLVANAVALDTQSALFAAQANHGGTLTRISVERLDHIGTMRAMRPAMAVVQWAWLK